MEEFKSRANATKRQFLGAEVQISLRQEILHLQKQLEDQYAVRSALEKALTNRPLSHDPTNEDSATKPAEELIKEIAILELEVVYLEKYLLSLYRNAFGERASFVSALDQKSKSITTTHEWILPEVPEHVPSTGNEKSPVENSSHFLLPKELRVNSLKESGEIGTKEIVDSSIQRSQSSVSQCSAHSFRTSPPAGALAEAVHSYYSLPLSMLEGTQVATSNTTSLAEHLGTRTPGHILETPNWLSEEMIKCISVIYSELAEPALTNHGFPSSPVSFSSSISDSSPDHHCDKLSPEPRKKSPLSSWMDNPFNIDRSKEFSGSYGATIEVHWISRDRQRLRHVKHLLQNFRSLVSRLEDVDPKKMKHDEKLAFWINVHNALVMHAFLVYGIPHNNTKRISLLLKAAYNVGGHTVSVDMIQNFILGCRLPRPGQWLHSLFFPKTKFKGGDARKGYAVNHPEPRLYFALCSGSHSDPTVRMYTAKRVFQELEAAKEDYIQTTLRIQKEHKIALPKIVDSFAKESGLCPAGFMELIEHFLPHSVKKSLQQYQNGKFWKRTEWIPHNFTFRYILSKDLAE
ncbi:hypothetical protein NMG60_11019624 [Bertholletia excelsa]